MTGRRERWLFFFFLPLRTKKRYCSTVNWVMEMERWARLLHPMAQGKQTSVHVTDESPKWRPSADTWWQLGWCLSKEWVKEQPALACLVSTGCRPYTPHTVITTHTHHREPGQWQGAGQTQAQKGGTDGGWASFLMLVCVSLKQHSPREGVGRSRGFCQPDLDSNPDCH